MKELIRHILREDIVSRRTGNSYDDLPKKDKMNVMFLYNYLVANRLKLYEIKDSHVLVLDDEGKDVAYMISKRDNEVAIDHDFKDKLLSLIKDPGYRDDLVEMSSYIYLDKNLPKEIKFDKSQRLRGGHIVIYNH
jgi:hypothetical protein